MAATPLAVRSGYRRLLRASRELFHQDVEALAASKTEIRRHFDEGARETNPAKVLALYGGIEEVVEMLHHNFVQGKLTGDNRYAVELKPMPETECGNTEVFEPIPIDTEKFK